MKNILFSMQLAAVDGREVYRCGICRLVQFQLATFVCRRCRKPLLIDDTEAIEDDLHADSTVSVPKQRSITQIVARQIKRHRIEHHLSQRDLAKRVGTARTYICKVENGRCEPTPESLARIARAIGVPVVALLDTEIPDPAMKLQEKLLSDPFLKELAPYVGNMTSGSRHMLLMKIIEMDGQRRRAA